MRASDGEAPTDSGQATKRLAAWCKSCADDDWPQFVRRLDRDGLSVDEVRRALASSSVDPPPDWAGDAGWVESALTAAAGSARPDVSDRPFAGLFGTLIDEARMRLQDSIATSAYERLTHPAHDDLCSLLLANVTDLCAPGLYDVFTSSAGSYETFAADMRTGGFRRLFDDKSVLLRLITVLVRQWLTVTAEFVERLAMDFDAIRAVVPRLRSASRVTQITGGLSDAHQGGRSVLKVSFDDGAQVMYKPKDLRVDVAWSAVVRKLNSQAPVTLRAVRCLAGDGYGWTEVIQHQGCVKSDDFRMYFRRAGALLALLHVFGAADMHQENIIADADYPVPIDLEAILQPRVSTSAASLGEEAFVAAVEMIGESVMSVGLLPSYGRAAGNGVVSVGGFASDWNARTIVAWRDVNGDDMRPERIDAPAAPTSNLPHVDGSYGHLFDHFDDFLSGFDEYAHFLGTWREHGRSSELYDDFAGLPVRKVLRPTQFYEMVLGRLKDDRTMHDGAVWSAQVDFLARLADWDTADDPLWPLQRGERTALLELAIPFFVVPSDGDHIRDHSGNVARIAATPGLTRARMRLARLDEAEIAWQRQIITQAAALTSDEPTRRADELEECTVAPGADLFLAEATAIAEELARHAIHRDGGAAWIGLRWLPESDVAQLTVLEHDLYNGAPGIAVFFAAHARVTQSSRSADLALSALAPLRAKIRSRNAQQLARISGIGGATGLGSMTYALAVAARLLDDAGLLIDARRVAAMITTERIAADRSLDVIGGSAGAILCLLRLHRDTADAEMLQRAIDCGEHLLRQQRYGPVGMRSWKGTASADAPLRGMSHGAAGFGFALDALAAATGRKDFADAASECVAFDRVGMAAEHGRSQWCHGAAGVGLARLGMLRYGTGGGDDLRDDIAVALDRVGPVWPGHVDTLCCGALGNVELAHEAGKTLARSDLLDLASRRLATIVQAKTRSGGYRRNGGAQRFNVGLFRGLAGVGYTALRTVDDSLPNILIWE